MVSRCAMQMRPCILDPVRWIYCLHLLLPEEKEGGRGRRKGALSVHPSGYTLHFSGKKNGLDDRQTDRQTGQLARQCDSQS